VEVEDRKRVLLLEELLGIRDSAIAKPQIAQMRGVAG